MKRGAFEMRREPTFDPAWAEADDIRPLGRPRPFARWRFAGRFVVAAALIAGLTIAARDKLHAPSGPTAWAEPTRAETASRLRPSSPVDGAGPLLRLEASGSDTAARSEPPRWSPSTGLREDALSAGSFAAIEAPFLRVILGEAQAEAEPAPSLFVAMARRAAEVQGLSVIRTGMRGRLDSKFGPFETVEAVLAGDGNRSCIGFQSLDARHLRVDGWLCGILGQAPQPSEVSCLIDRLMLAGQAAPTIETAFAEAETRRGTGCAGTETVGSRNSDRTGSIGRRATAKGRSRKNEAGMRQND